MGVPTFGSDLVAVDEAYIYWIRAIRGIEVMSVAESAHHRDRGAWIESLHRIENRGIGEPGNICDRPELTVVKRTGQRATLHSDAHAAGGETQSRDTASRPAACICLAS